MLIERYEVITKTRTEIFSDYSLAKQYREIFKGEEVKVVLSFVDVNADTETKVRNFEITF